MAYLSYFSRICYMQMNNSGFNILTEYKIKHAKVTESEFAAKVKGVNGETERELPIKYFRNRQLQVLLGIKCLDEGIDIKNARIAVLLASSTNPREYVQRIGRVIRVEENKKESIIYDLIVMSCNKSHNRVLANEIKRALSIAENADNYQDVIALFEKNGVDLNGYQ